MVQHHDGKNGARHQAKALASVSEDLSLPTPKDRLYGCRGVPQAPPTFEENWCGKEQFKMSLVHYHDDSMCAHCPAEIMAGMLLVCSHPTPKV